MSYEDDEIYIELFNEFVIHYKGKELHMHDILSKQTLSLLEILILHNGKSVTKEQLCDLLCANNDNPDSALKFNVFRLRKLLKEVDILSHLSLIQTDKNGYRFAPNIKWTSDCQRFDVLHENLKFKTVYSIEDFENMNILLEIYRGKLYHPHTTLWFTQKEEYYRSAYLHYIAPLCEHYILHQDFDEVERIAQKAVILEPSVENNYYYYILSFVNQKEFAIAYEVYVKAVQRLSEDFEITPSSRLSDLYKEIINENDQRLSPQTIMERYRNKEFNQGAFYCTTAVFDYIYEMRLRTAQRDNKDFFLYVFELDNRNLDTLDEAMKKLKSCIVHTLRSSDVFTKLNRSQYLVLLSCPSSDIALTIAQRVNANYRNKISYNTNILQYHLCQVND